VSLSSSHPKCCRHHSNKHLGRQNVYQAQREVNIRDTDSGGEGDKVIIRVRVPAIHPTLHSLSIQQKRLSRDHETATINAKTRESLGISPDVELDPTHFPITSHLDNQAYWLACGHRYQDYTIEDLPKDQLTFSLDVASREGLRHHAQSVQANKAIALALAQRDYVSLKNYAEGQVYRFRVLMALADLVKEGHYVELHQEEVKSREFLVRELGEDVARELTIGVRDSVTAEKEIDDALSGAA